MSMEVYERTNGKGKGRDGGDELWKGKGKGKLERRGEGRKVLPFWQAGRHVRARERSGKGPTVNMAIWKEGEKKGEAQGRGEHMRSREGRGEEQSRAEEGGRRDVHYCSSVEEGGVSL